ncbi:signal transduction histidine kinase [Streptomyces phaeochromogenes]|jgi:signal transduction histidine kinase|uniref:sensor histidine kinase n=1 Tax=Streptomyces phaeochromogenes TaxID=1923 RepID=UPI00278D5E58|nr:sensor histidine kinase [Streptomyces phaeochromogenes]MDQ0946798.1 signal transduction histidine kinase [Streptomyces phaeochromogenes]
MSARSWITPAVARLRAANPYVVDAALAALVLFAASLQWMFPDDGDDRLTWQGFLLGAGTALPLVWRRRAPYLAACGVSVFTPAMAVYHAPPPDVMYGGLVVLYTTAAIALPWQRRLMLVGWLAGVSLTMMHKEGTEPFEYAFQLLSCVSAYGFGVLARLQRAYTAALEDRARRLERERAADTERAAAQERARIARDMHDILAHAVSLMVVQAEAGPVVVRSDPARAEAAFDAIAGAGRDAMTQLRRNLGVLKDEPVNGTSVPQPQPGVAALTDLVRQVAETAGLRVELHATGEPRPLHQDTEVAAYRVVQEALTNTVKHAYASCARVELDWTEDELTLTVTDDGRGPADLGGAGNGNGRGGAHGHGLIGVRERAAACGGTARTGPGPDGGFRVVVRLPVAVDRQAALG